MILLMSVIILCGAQVSVGRSACSSLPTCMRSVGRGAHTLGHQSPAELAVLWRGTAVLQLCSQDKLKFHVQARGDAQHVGPKTTFHIK